MSGPLALIRRKRAARAKKHHAHGHAHHGGAKPAHKGKRSKKAPAAKRTPRPKPRTVAA